MRGQRIHALIILSICIIKLYLFTFGHSAHNRQNLFKQHGSFIIFLFLIVFYGGFIFYTPILTLLDFPEFSTGKEHKGCKKKQYTGS